ncbi:MAG: rhodanese-like domain-containing protein [Chloroflexia bacterium]|nr:rhodanese-like domain-containing protein [Chloroflexia bacterium]
MEISAAQMVASAKAHIDNLSPDEVAAELKTGSVTLVDIREAEERLERGHLPGAIHAPRGMLEFYADPTSPYHRPEFDLESRLILTCASGGRSALATETLQRMGYANVAHLDGGLNAWIAQGLPCDDG